MLSGSRLFLRQEFTCYASRGWHGAGLAVLERQKTHAVAYGRQG